ncbi:MAG: COG1361 S-layer family protein [Clostridia bacterium]|nr:COG1361 S-layer family protein [Clostridia bacterium]
MKKFLASLLLVVCLFSFITVVHADDDDRGGPKVIFENKSEVPEVDAGDSFKYKFVIKNTGDETAKNITITTEDSEAPIRWETAISSFNVNRLTPGFNREIELAFTVKETADNGIYSVPLKIEYTNMSGSPYTSAQTVYFKVKNELSKPLINIESVRTLPENIVAGGRVSLNFVIHNVGDLNARRVKLTLSGLDKDGFMVADSINTRYLDKLSGKSQQTITYDLLVSEDIKKGTAALTAKLEYYDPDNKEYTDEKTIYLSGIQGKEDKKEDDDDDDDEKKSTPKIIISSYNANPSAVVAGKRVNFSFTFRNTSTTKTIKNMKIVVSSDDGVFNIEAGSNSFYVAELLPQQEMTRMIGLRPNQDTLSRAYPVSINFDYEDGKGNPYTSTEKINIQVVEYSNLTINNISGPYEIYEGANGSISFEYYNMGKAVVSNVSATVEGAFKPKSDFNYIGNLEAGKSGYFDLDVVPRTGESGECTGILVLSYEDSRGEVHTVRKDFTGYVYGGEDTPSFNNDEPIIDDFSMGDEKEPLAWWKILLIVLGIAFVVAIITIIIVKKIRLKKMEEEL